MLSTEVKRLMEVIANGIAIRGIYALMDQRLDLICGPDSLQNIDDPEVRRKITDLPILRLLMGGRLLVTKPDSFCGLIAV